MLLVVGLLGCISEEPFSPLDPTGTFTLQSMAGSPLPYTFPGSGITVTAGSLVIDATFRYSESTTSYPPGGAPTTGSIGGDYAVIGNGTVGFTEDGLINPGPHFTGSFSPDGNTITLNGFGPVRVYRK